MNGEFSLEELSSLKNYKEMINYTKSFFPSIGKGSSRLVYKMDEEKVIKIAKNDNGVDQNDEEYSKGLSNTPLFAKVYDCDDESRWIIMEYAPKVKKSQVKELYGVSFDMISDSIALLFNGVSPKSRIYIEVDPKAEMMYADFIKWLHDEPTKSIRFSDKLGNFMKNIMIYFRENRLRKSDVMDWFTISNWGIAIRNGEPELVIIDMGLNEDIL